MSALETVAWRWTLPHVPNHGWRFLETDPGEPNDYLAAEPLTPLAPAQAEIERLRDVADAWMSAASKAGQDNIRLEARALAAEEQVKVLSEATREKIAFTLMLYELDMDGNWPAEKVWQALEHRNAEHSGDCTKECWTCMRCAADEVYKIADAIFAALQQKPSFVETISEAVNTTQEILASAQQKEKPDE